MRNTRQKQAIRKAFADAGRPLSPEEALSGAHGHHKRIGIATIYRNIKTLVEDGWLVPIDMPDKSTRYELSGKDHTTIFNATGVASSTNWRAVSQPSSQSCHAAFA